MKNNLNKKHLRKRALKAEIDKEVDKKIVKDFLDSDFYKEAQSLFITSSFGNEISTHEIIDQALRDKKSVYLPKTNKTDHTMVPVRIERYPEGLVRDSFGILEPDVDIEKIEKEPDLDLIIVPGLLFNKEGYRIGYGGGFYDRFLESSSSPTLALCREAQLLDEIVVEDHDRRVDFILTEDRLLDTNS